MNKELTYRALEQAGFDPWEWTEDSTYITNAWGVWNQMLGLNKWKTEDEYYPAAKAHKMNISREEAEKLIRNFPGEGSRIWINTKTGEIHQRINGEGQYPKELIAAIKDYIIE